MVAELPETHRPAPAQSLFCWADGRCEVLPVARPEVSMQVRETFAAYFAPDFAAAMTEHRHDHDGRAVDAA
ncbi:MAG: hypothetical protein ACKOVA_10945 [Novosphingobium sp.]